MKKAYSLIFKILLLTVINSPSISNAALLTYDINFFGIENTAYGLTPTGTFTINSNYLLDSQQNIPQQDIVAFEVIVEGSRGPVIFDLSDTVDRPLNISIVSDEFYFSVGITDYSIPLPDQCNDPNYVPYSPYSVECDYATFNMYSYPESEYTLFSATHRTFSNPDDSGNWYGFLDYPAVTLISTSPVPLPAAVWFFASGLISLIFFTRRK